MKSVSHEQSEAFLLLAEQCEGRSPLYGGLCRAFAGDPAVAGIIESPPRWDAPLRLLAGLHYLVLTRQMTWDEAAEAPTAHRDFLKQFVAEKGIQTNEVQRCWMLLPCFLEIAGRTKAETFDLIEIGPSAGLNLEWDRYDYVYRAGTWGPQGARLELAGEERRPIPAGLLALKPRVRSRIGIDLNPIDAASDDGAMLLKSFVWPDQTWRLDLLDRAIASLRKSPPNLVRGDIAEVLPRILGERRSDSLTVVWQTAVLHYLPEERRQLVYDAMADAGTKRGQLAFVETVTPKDDDRKHFGLTIQIWPGGERHEIANADFHGAWIEWLA